MTGDNSAFLFVLVVGFSGLALRADALDDIEALSAVALASIEVINLIGSTLNSADSLVDVIKLASRALGTEIVD